MLTLIIIIAVAVLGTPAGTALTPQTICAFKGACVPVLIESDR